MRPEDRDAAYLWDMREAARTARDLVAGMDLDAFLADRRTQLAVERPLELVGEAARRVSEPLRETHPEIRDVPTLLDLLEPLLPQVP